MALHHARALIREDELLIVDGNSGVVIVDPDKPVLAEFGCGRSSGSWRSRSSSGCKTTRPSTLDGTRIELHANIELPEDVPEAKENAAAGIGLFRSEFLFLSRRGDLPDEDEQFEAYRRVAVEMEGLPVTIRTLDLGADKHAGRHASTSVPAQSGARACAPSGLCLAEPQMFRHATARDPARLALRPGPHADPDAVHAHEMQQTLQLIDDAKAEPGRRERGLRARNPGRRHDRDSGRGARAAHLHSKRLDFLSIGTNDLIQYTLAIDRTDDAVAHLYDPLHPAVLQLVAHVIRGANKAGVPVAVCGEMAGDIAAHAACCSAWGCGNSPCIRRSC